MVAFLKNSQLWVFLCAANESTIDHSRDENACLNVVQSALQQQPSTTTTVGVNTVAQNVAYFNTVEEMTAAGATFSQMPHFRRMTMTDQYRVQFNRFLRYLPVASLIAMFICWIGTLLFCVKMYEGISQMAVIGRDLFKGWAGHFETAKKIFVAIGVIMVILTLLFGVVGVLATRNTTRCDRGKSPGRLTWKFGGRLACAVLLVLNYLLSICWLLVLTGVVALLALQIGFTPLCLKRSGFVDQYCFNYTVLAKMLGEEPGIQLSLCGNIISNFCHMAHDIIHWYWYAYGGCFVVILGMMQFNACFAANFAHNTRVFHYIRQKSMASLATTLTDGSPLVKKTGDNQYVVFSTALPKSNVSDKPHRCQCTCGGGNGGGGTYAEPDTRNRLMIPPAYQPERESLRKRAAPALLPKPKRSDPPAKKLKIPSRVENAVAPLPIVETAGSHYGSNSSPYQSTLSNDHSQSSSMNIQEFDGDTSVKGVPTPFTLASRRSSLSSSQTRPGSRNTAV